MTTTRYDLREYPILYVDDEQPNRVVMKHSLGKEFSLQLAASGEEALEILAREPVAVLLTDQRMPGMSGVDLAERALKDFPDVVRVIITAYSDLEATIDAINRGRVRRFIKKPWTREELVAVMRESVHAFHSERLIRRQQQLLLKLDRVSSVAVMAAAIAHDLRQPVTYIKPTIPALLRYVRDLVQLPLPRGVLERLQEIEEGLSDIETGFEKLWLVSDTLLKSLKSQENGRSSDDEREMVAIDLRDVIDGAVVLTRLTVTSVARLQVELPERPVVVRSDEGPLLQLLVNLLLNAAQSIKSGHKLTNEIRVRLEAEERALLEVCDTGCGIPAENLAQVFDTFFTTKKNGSGLGLAICRQIVEDLGGKISVESEPGSGSRFKIALPLS